MSPSSSLLLTLNPQPSTILIRNGRLIDPLTGTDTIGDLFIRDGLIAPLSEAPRS